MSQGKLDLEELRKKFPGTDDVYLEAIIEHLDKKDYDVLDGVENLPQYIESKRRLALAGLEKFGEQYKFKVYQNKEGNEKRGGEIDYNTLNRCIDDLLGYYNGNKFVLGPLAQNYLKADRIMKVTKENQREARKFNMRIRKQKAMELYKQYSNIIEKIKNKSAKNEEIIYLLDQIKENLEYKQGDKVDLKLRDAYKSVPRAELLPGEVKVEVWKRNPAVDLSYSDEFYACAFLGGVNDWAAPKYLRNAAIVMLDFILKEGDKERRRARAILGAGIERNENGKLTGKTYMIVDSVEGSDRLNPKITLEPIIEYAKWVGFNGIIFSENALNTYPHRVLDALEEDKEKYNVRKGTRKLQLLYADGKEYFESIEETGITGNVKGYVIEFGDEM